MSNKPRIGLIGVGLMGHGIAKNLLLKGFPLTLLANRNRVPVEDILAEGRDRSRQPGGSSRGVPIFC